MRGSSCITTRPAPMLRCPTSELPICPCGRPTSLPEVCSSACGHVAQRRSKVGVLACRTALSARSSRQPQPSRMTSMTGRCVGISASFADYSGVRRQRCRGRFLAHEVACFKYERKARHSGSRCRCGACRDRRPRRCAGRLRRRRRIGELHAAVRARRWRRVLPEGDRIGRARRNRACRGETRRPHRRHRAARHRHAAEPAAPRRYQEAAGAPFRAQARGLAPS